MRIYAQNMFRMNRTDSRNTCGQFLPGAARSADAQKAVEQREIRQKVEALSSFFVSEKNVPVKAAQKIEEYYQITGSLSDSITYKEARLKYLQSEYEKIAAGDSGKRAEKMRELIESEYKDMAGVLNYTADLMRDSLRNSELVYGKSFSEEYRKLLGDVPDKLYSIANRLKESGSAEEALGYLGAAKEIGRAHV